MSYSIVIVGLLLAFFGANGSGSDESRFIDQTSAQYVTKSVDGKIAPDEVPLIKKLEAFALTYTGQLDDQFDPTDRRNVFQFVRDAAQLDGAQSAQMMHRISTRVCSDLKAGESAVAIAARIGEFETEQHQRKTELYESFFERLSAEGQSLLSDYLDTEIAPGISYVEVDAEAIAAGDPVGYKANIERICEIKW